jgi:DNA transformation protein
MDREDIAELFLAFGTVDIRRMFSGFGLFAEDVCFSLFLRGELYLKADETTAPRFAEEGSRPFSYSQPRSGKVVTVNSFWRLPERLYDDPEELAAWARQALSVAQRSKAAKPKRKPAPKKRAKPIIPRR